MVVMCDYSSKVYDALGAVEAVAKLVHKEDVRGLGKIVVKHGYANSVCAIIAHRHFDLAADEAMVEQTMEDDIRVAKPQPIASINRSLPNLLACNADGVWFPVAFGTDAKCDLSAWKNDAFLTEVGNYLLTNNLCDKLHLTLRDRDATEGNEPRLYVERNYEDDRRSETRPLRDVDNDEIANAIPTTFGFNENVDCIEEAFCFYIRTCIPSGIAHIHGSVHT